MSKYFKFIPSILAVIAVLLIGGATVFAEKSLPGELLHKVKIYVNEPVSGLFAFSKEEKSEWKERLVERRLDEAQRLISSNNFNETKRIDLSDKLNQQIDEFIASVNELSLKKDESINSSDINIRLQASINAYKSIIEKINKDSSMTESTKTESQKIFSSISDLNKKVSLFNDTLESNIGTDYSKAQNSSIQIPDFSLALEKNNALEEILKSLKLSYQKEKVNLSLNLQNQINNKLIIAETFLEEGKTLVDSKSYAQAIDKFQSAINNVNSAKLLLLSNTIKGKIENDMNIGDIGDIDDENDDMGEYKEGKQDTFNEKNSLDIQENSNSGLNKRESELEGD